jgi:hypothetical protein
MAALHRELKGRVLGPGLVHRVVAKVQRRYFDLPQLDANDNGVAGRAASGGALTTRPGIRPSRDQKFAPSCGDARRTSTTAA